MVACVEEAGPLDRCLASLQATCAGIETEIVVVSAVEGAHGREISSGYPGVKFLYMPPGTLAPRLWSEGITESRGPVVALTISECSATRGWASAITEAISGGASAAGGPLSLKSQVSPTDAAVFFLRYSAFLNGKSEAATLQIAGDNCAYSRDALDIGGWTRESGFWEYDINKRLLDHGKTIVWVSQALMEFGDAGTLSSNAARRFAHGRLFGASRTDHGESSLKIAVASPLVPFVLFARAAGRAWRRGAYRRSVIRSTPAFLVLAVSWALGEAVGAIGGGVADRG